MFKRIIACMLLFSMGLLVCACGGAEKPDTSSKKDESSSNTDSVPSNPDKDTVDATLTLKVKKGEVKKFKSDRPYDSSKEDISLILVVGQSNFTSSVGYGPEYSGFTQGKTNVMPDSPTRPVKGTVFSSVPQGSISVLNDSTDAYTLTDTTRSNYPLGGATPSFGKAWHDITGTKVVFVQAAVGAVGVHEWTPDPQNYVCECPHNGKGQLYSTAVNKYKASYEALSQNYNIVYTGYIWNQGEHDEYYGKPDKPNTVNSDLAYYVAYKSMHDGFMNELNLDFGGISVVRSHYNGPTAQGSMSLTIARSAQYKLCNDIDNLYMISTISETCDSSMMDQSNTIHYSQRTFNLMGADCAVNLASYLGIIETPDFSGVELYSSTGNKLIAFDENSSFAAIGDATDIISRSSLTNHVLCKLSTLGTGYTLSGFTFMVGDKDMTEHIDEFGAIDWTSITKQNAAPVKTVQVKCIVE